MSYILHDGDGYRIGTARTLAEANNKAKRWIKTEVAPIKIYKIKADDATRLVLVKTIQQTKNPRTLTYEGAKKRFGNLTPHWRDAIGMTVARAERILGVVAAKTKNPGFIKCKAVRVRKSGKGYKLDILK